LSSETEDLFAKSPGFTYDAPKLFSLENEQIRALISGLQHKGVLFSTAFVSKEVKSSIFDAISIRDALIFLSHNITEHASYVAPMKKYLVSLGFPPQKVEFVIKSIKAMDKKAILAANFLWNVKDYLQELVHWEYLGMEVNYTKLDYSDKQSMMFPLLRLTLQLHSREPAQNEVVRFDLDANDLENLIRLLQQWFREMVGETKALKQSLGDGFTNLVGDTDV